MTFTYRLGSVIINSNVEASKQKDNRISFDFGFHIEADNNQIILWEGTSFLGKYLGFWKFYLSPGHKLHAELPIKSGKLEIRLNSVDQQTFNIEVSSNPSF